MGTQRQLFYHGRQHSELHNIMYPYEKMFIQWTHITVTLKCLEFGWLRQQGIQ